MDIYEVDLISFEKYDYLQMSVHTTNYMIKSRMLKEIGFDGEKIMVTGLKICLNLFQYHCN